jgi:hypothetical protein
MKITHLYLNMFPDKTADINWKKSVQYRCREKNEAGTSQWNVAG